MRNRLSGPITNSLVGVAILGMVNVAQAQGGPRFEITVTNLTARQVFTPILVASHRAGVELFTPGQAASPELEALAEGGDTVPLTALLLGSPDVRDVTTGAPLLPGQSQTLSAATGGGFDHVSVAAMLVPTNDAFVAITGTAGPRGSRILTLVAVAYDAGTEANDELCAATIPGPPGVCGGEGFNPSRDGAEGFVHVHRGIHGVGELGPDVWDWRNPVAQVTIRRLR